MSRFLRSARNDSGASHGMTMVLRSELQRCPARNDVPLSFRGSRRPSSVIPRRSQTLLCHSEEVENPPLSFRGGRRPTKESSLRSASRPGNNPFVISGIRPQMQQIGLVGHSARRRGNDSAHFGRFAGRVCIRTAPRGTFSAFAAGQAVWQPTATNRP